MNSTPPRAAGRSAAGWTLPQAPINLMRNFTLENIRRAIEGGLDINKQDDDGSTLLMEAVARGKEEIVGYLLDNGADINIQDENSETALWYYKDAMYKTDDPEKIVQMLLEAGAWFLPNVNGKMVIDMAEDLYDELASELAYRNAYNSPYSHGSNNRYEYRNNSLTLGRIQREITEENRAREQAEQKEMANRYLAKEKAENNANAAWRASVGLPPSEREGTREYPPTTRRAKNIRDLIRLYISQFVREIKLGSIAAGANKDSTIFVDLRMPVYELKKIIEYFFQYNTKFDLVYPGFHLPGKKVMDDDRVLSDYGIRNGSRLIISLRIQSGYRGGTRRSKRRSQQRKKTRSRRN